MYQLYLKKNEEKRIVAGGAIIYANEVERISGDGTNGVLSSVYSHEGRFLGKGYINHLSKIIVRIFIRDNREDNEELYKERIVAANNFRKNIGYDNAYRMVFSEADDLPGLIIDKYDNVLVIECSSLGIDQRKAMIVKCLVDLFNPLGIYERCEKNLRSKEGLESKEDVLYGEVPQEVIIQENGLKMAVDIRGGQKTGYFLDQKENRLAARRYAKDASVLDCFSNTGGFSMNCATTAKSVKAIDISEKAIEMVKRNAQLNGFQNVEGIKGDVFEVLRNYKEQGQFFDLVILDPPAFTKSVSEIQDALRGYKDINILAMKLVKKGGFLITSSCSHYVTFTLFEKMLMEAAKETGKQVRVLEIHSQAPDHPSLLSAEETSYLKFLVLQIM